MANNRQSEIPSSKQFSLTTEHFESTLDTAQQASSVSCQPDVSLSLDVLDGDDKSTTLRSLSLRKYENKHSSNGFEIRGTLVNLQDDQLEQKIYDILRTQCFLPNLDTNRFLPRCALRDVLCYDVVRFILRQKLSDEQKPDEIADQIFGNRGDNKYIQIFAILVLIAKAKYIRYFIQEKICDQNLPLAFNELCLRLTSCKTAYLDTFCQRQWEVFVPVFDFSPDKIRTRKFRSQVRLPFEDRRYMANGGHGKIIKVRIHRSHLDGYSLDNYDFAVKQFEITDKGRDMWENEIEVFERFGGSNVGHKHLAKLLQAYEHVGIGYFLIFPLAKGSLVDYWKHNPSQPNDAKWVIEQCLGISAALCKIHRHSSWKGTKGDNLGRHGDIKPENILWFKNSTADPGSLVLGDFTLTRFHSANTVNITAPGDRGFTQTYRPPEVEIHSKTRFAQSYDVWSLGCVYLEFLTWYLLGYNATRGQGCRSFVDVRVNDDDGHCNNTAEDKFFKVKGNNQSAFVKESVKKWIKLLHSSQHCSNAIHALLDLVEERMLVVNPEDRRKIEVVRKELETIFNKCSDKEYWYSGVPVSNPRIEADLAKFAKQPSSQLGHWHTFSSRKSIIPSVSSYATKGVMQQLENLILFEYVCKPLGLVMIEESHGTRTGGDEEYSLLQSPDRKDSNNQLTPTSITYPSRSLLSADKEPRRSIMSDEVRLLSAGTGTSVGLETVAPEGLRTGWWGSIRMKVQHLWNWIIVSIRVLCGGINTDE